MENKIYYYLINNEIKKANYEMPIRAINYQWHYENWFNSIQPCNITESEFRKIKMALPPDYSKPIDVTDIIYDNNGVIVFKKKGHNNTVDLDELQNEFNEMVDNILDSEDYHDIIWKFFLPHLKQPKQVESEKIESIEFADWISENYFVSSSGLYHHNNWNGDMDTLVNYTTKELYEIFLKEKNIS